MQYSRADARLACELHTHRVWQSHADPDCHAYGHANTDAHADSHNCGNAYCNAYGYTNTDGNTNGNSNAYIDGNINRMYKVYTDAEASPNSEAAPVADGD